MTNNLTITEQLVLFREIVRTRPFLSAALIVLVSLYMFFGSREPQLWKFSAVLTGPDREIETLIIANPKIDKRDVFVEFAPAGHTSDLGFDQSTAIEFDNKTRSARLNVGERGVSIITVLRKDLQHGPTKAVAPAREVTPTDSIMRQLALSYLIGLALYLHSFIRELTLAWGVLTGFNIFGRTNLRDWRDQAKARFTAFRGTPPKQEGA